MNYSFSVTLNEFYIFNDCPTKYANVQALSLWNQQNLLCWSQQTQGADFLASQQHLPDANLPSTSQFSTKIIQIQLNNATHNF